MGHAISQFTLEKPLTPLSQIQQSIATYWQDKPVKAWVVKLESGRKNTLDSETKYVRAKDHCSAIRTARFNCFLKGKIRCLSVRLMGPSDIHELKHFLTQPGNTIPRVAKALYSSA